MSSLPSPITGWGALVRPAAAAAGAPLTRSCPLEAAPRITPPPLPLRVEAPRQTSSRRHFDQIKTVAKVNPKIMASLQELCRVGVSNGEG